MRSQEECGAHNEWQNADCLLPAGHTGNHQGHAHGDGITVRWNQHTRGDR